MHFKVHYVTSLALVFIFADVILVARGQLPPDLQDGTARSGGIPDTAGPLNGAGPPDNPSRDPNLPGNTNGFNPPQRQFNTHLTNPVCREGWFEAKINKVPICLYLNKNPLSWEDARDSCRNEFGFLIKLEAPVSVGPLSLQQYLVNNHTQSIWTGLHGENDHLVWDELTPHLVRHYNDYVDPRPAHSRIWEWDVDDLDDETDTCGELEISDLWQITPDHSRKKRSSDDTDTDHFFSSVSKERDKASAANPLASMFGNPSTSGNSGGNMQMNKRLIQNMETSNVQRTVTTITRSQSSPMFNQRLQNANQGVQGFRQMQGALGQHQEDGTDTFPMIPRLDQPRLLPQGIEQWNNRLKMRNKKVTLAAHTQFTKEEEKFLNSLANFNANLEDSDGNQDSTTQTSASKIETEDDDNEAGTTMSPNGMKMPNIKQREDSDNEKEKATFNPLKLPGFDPPIVGSSNSKGPATGMYKEKPDPLDILTIISPPVASTGRESSKKQDEDDDNNKLKADDVQSKTLPAGVQNLQPIDLPLPPPINLPNIDTEDSAEVKTNVKNVDSISKMLFEGKSGEDDGKTKTEKERKSSIADLIGAQQPSVSVLKPETPDVESNTEDSKLSFSDLFAGDPMINNDNPFVTKDDDDGSSSLIDKFSDSEKDKTFKSTDDKEKGNDESKLPKSVFGDLFTGTDQVETQPQITDDSGTDTVAVLDTLDDLVEKITEDKTSNLEKVSEIVKDDKDSENENGIRSLFTDTSDATDGISVAAITNDEADDKNADEIIKDIIDIASIDDNIVDEMANTEPQTDENEVDSESQGTAKTVPSLIMKSEGDENDDNVISDQNGDDLVGDDLPGVSFIGKNNQRPQQPPIFVSNPSSNGRLGKISDLLDDMVESVTDTDSSDDENNDEGSILDDAPNGADINDNDAILDTTADDAFDLPEQEERFDDIGNSADVFDVNTDDDGLVDFPDFSDFVEETSDNLLRDKDDSLTDSIADDTELPKEAASNGDEQRVHDFGDLVDELEEMPDGIHFDHAAVLRQDIPPADIVQHIPQININNDFSKMFARRKAKMKLSNCKKKRPSVCFSYPLSLEKNASPCGDDWHGNVFVDKCFRVIFPAISFTNAVQRCKQEGGILARIESELESRLALMLIARSQNQQFRPGRVAPIIWVNRDPVWSNEQRVCHILSPTGNSMRDCTERFEAVCEKTADKPAQNVNGGMSSAESLESSEEDSGSGGGDHSKLVTLSVQSHDNSLNCDLHSPFPELPTLWFKDGLLVDIKIKRRSESVLPSTGTVGRLHSPLPNTVLSPTSSIYLNTILQETLKYLYSHHISPEVLQGKYWCEVWSTKPFMRRKSKPYIVTYSDVISFVGSMTLPHMTEAEAVLYNKINRAFIPVQKAGDDLNFVLNSAFYGLKTHIPVEYIRTYGKHIAMTSPLKLQYNTYLTMSKNYTMANEGIAYVLLRRQLREIMSNLSYILTLPEKTPPYAIRSIDLTSTVACPTVKLRDHNTGLMAMFSRSATHTNVESVELCDGERAGSASCNGNFFTGAYWDKVAVRKSCNNPTSVKGKSEDDDDEDDDDDDDDDKNGEYGKVMSKMTSEERLKELAESNVEEDDVETVIEETAVITEETEELTAVDVDYIAEIMEKTDKVKRMTKQISRNILKTVDKVMDMDEKEIKKANKETSAANRIIQRFEKVAETSELEDDGKLKLVEQNVAMEIWRLDLQKNMIIGMAAKQYKEERLTNTFTDQDIITIYNQSQLYDKVVEAAIELPPELIHEAMTEKGKETRLVMVVYRDGRLFRASELSNSDDPSHSEELGKLNSFVISASISGRRITGLTNKVKTVFRPLQNVVDSVPVCAFWDFNLNNFRGGWSSEGCVYDGMVNGHQVCKCDHLTNFAVLMDFHGQGTPISREHVESLSIISLIGLSLSILGLALTIISYIFFKKLRHGRAQQTLFNLALAMLCSWVVFLVGIKQTHSHYGCLIVAALLHYFILSSFMWMLMEAFLQYLTFVKVLGTYVTRYTLKTVIIAWGLPFIPVICVLSIDYELYNGGTDYCWMSLDAFYWAFALPVGLICLSNLIVFIVTIISICRRPSGLRSNQSKQKLVIANLQAAITSFILLGLTWILGYLSLLPHARIVFQYAFTILNSLQGFFIFVLFVARKKRVRDQWMIVCCCKTPAQEKATRSLSASASIPSSCSSSKSNFSGRTERSDSTQTTTSFVNHEYQSIYSISTQKRRSRESLYYRK